VTQVSLGARGDQRVEQSRRPRRSVVREDRHAVLGAEQHDVELTTIGDGNL